jgi:hypothetical protein
MRDTPARKIKRETHARERERERERKTERERQPRKREREARRLRLEARLAAESGPQWGPGADPRRRLRGGLGGRPRASVARAVGCRLGALTVAIQGRRAAGASPAEARRRSPT